MSYDVTTTPAVGDATKRSDYVRLQSDIKAVRQQSWDFIGGLGEFIEDAANTWVDLPNGKIKEINGDDTSGLSVYLAMTCLQDAAGVVTVETRLYNIDAGAAVAGSDASLANPGTSPAYQKGSTFTLPAGTKKCKVQIRRTTTAARVAALVEVFTV
jgi:hypothetical protein